MGWFLGFMFVLVCFIWISLHTWYPVSQTRPPVKKILQLIKDLDGFTIHYGSFEPPEHLEDKWVDFTLVDNVTGKKTYYYKPILSNTGSVIVYGDLSWANEWETYRIYKVASKINSRQKDELLAAKRAATEKRNEERREEALKLYENR